MEPVQLEKKTKRPGPNRRKIPGTYRVSERMGWHFISLSEFLRNKKIQTKTKNLNIQKTGFFLPPFNETHLSRAAQSFPQNFQTQTDESDK